MNRPNLFIPGFPKSGTSALHSALVKHSEIYDGGKKEPKTYSYNNRYQNKDSFFEQYYNNSNSSYIIDSSTTYMVCKNAVKRILQDTPNAKFIVLARDPIDRIVSHYNWLSSHNLINNPPIEEIEKHLNEKFDYRNHYRGKYKSYIDFSFYGHQMENLLKLTKKSNVLFLLYEELFSDFESHKKIIGDFLNLNLQEINIEKVNRTSFKEHLKNKPSLKERIEGRLTREYDILKGNPRGLNVNAPKKFKTTRNEIEDMLTPIFRADILLLEKLGYQLDSWLTYQNL
jgi:hypothetical protein